MKPRYYIQTWSIDLQKFTPQKGCRVGPYSLWGLRKALRALRNMGYGGDRNDPSILVEDERAYRFVETPHPVLTEDIP